MLAFSAWRRLGLGVSGPSNAFRLSGVSEYLPPCPECRQTITTLHAHVGSRKLAHVTSPAPAQDAVEWQARVIDAIPGSTPYTGYPTPESDTAWTDLLKGAWWSHTGHSCSGLAMISGSAAPNFERRYQPQDPSWGDGASRVSIPGLEGRIRVRGIAWCLSRASLPGMLYFVPSFPSHYTVFCFGFPADSQQKRVRKMLYRDYYYPNMTTDEWRHRMGHLG